MAINLNNDRTCYQELVILANGLQLIKGHNVHSILSDLALFLSQTCPCFYVSAKEFF